jgi:non-ribosomal peptide synthetase component F
MTTKTVTIDHPVLEYDRFALRDTAAGQSAAIERWACIAGLVPAGQWTAQRIHELVAAQVARTPDAIALVVGERSVSYDGLGATANPLRYMEDVLADAVPDAHIHSDRDRLQERPDLAWAT